MADNQLKVTSSNTHFENILAFYMDDKTPDKVKMEKLSDIEVDLKKRWETAFISLIEFRSPRQAAQRLMKLFDISEATAYRDVQRCEMLFGSFQNFNKDAWKAISIERKHSLYQLALKDGNLELAYKIDKEIDEVLGIKDDDSKVNLEKLLAQSYEIMMSKKQTKLVNQVLKKGGSVNMNVPDTMEIDFEEIHETNE
ncbi:hypothetical protein MG296_10590 [Flavobacteriaceae bacterium TK19130]|nr:hypothetical protein [Thermobacterium salinum]